MVSYPTYRCWEIMHCDNLDCPARREPDIPCWELARKVEAYHTTTNTCNDCVVYLLKDEGSIPGTRKLQDLIRKRESLKNKGTCHHVCI